MWHYATLTHHLADATLFWLRNTNSHVYRCNRNLIIFFCTTNRNEFVPRGQIWPLDPIVEQLKKTALLWKNNFSHASMTFLFLVCASESIIDGANCSPEKDQACYIFDGQSRFMSLVGPFERNTNNWSGKILQQTWSKAPNSSILNIGVANQTRTASRHRLQLQMQSQSSC